MTRPFPRVHPLSLATISAECAARPSRASSVGRARPCQKRNSHAGGSAASALFECTSLKHLEHMFDVSGFLRARSTWWPGQRVGRSVQSRCDLLTDARPQKRRARTRRTRNRSRRAPARCSTPPARPRCAGCRSSSSRRSARSRPLALKRQTPPETCLQEQGPREGWR